MSNAKSAGLITLLEQIVRNKATETLIQEHIDLLITHSKTKLSIAEAKLARRLGKTEKSAKKYVTAAEHFLRLSKAGKRVSAQKLYDSLCVNYPEQDWRWKYHTIRGWHKLMSQAVLEVPIGSGEDVDVWI